MDPDRYIPEPNSGCWLFLGFLDDDGYGRFYYKARTQMAHRAAYKELRGPIPHGLVLDHICRVRSCVNPWHLRAVTHAENMRAPGSQSGHQNKSKTECIHGHIFDEANTYWWRGKRNCRKCNLRYHERTP